MSQGTYEQLHHMCFSGIGVRLWLAMIGGIVMTASSSAQPICQQQRLASPDSAPFSGFGFDVAIWEETALVGTQNLNPNLPGTAYIFTYSDAAGWEQVQELTPPDGEGGDLFGEQVAIEDDVLAVGARSHCHDGAPGCGAVYIWRKIGGAWVFEQEILPPEEVSKFGDPSNFGFLVEFDNGRLAITRPFGVYLYAFDGNTWVLQQSLPEANPGNIAYGAAAALDSDLLIVGASGDDSICRGSKPEFCGLVYVYRFNGEAFVEEQILAPSDPGGGRRFGHAVAVSNETIIAAAQNPAAIYVFEYDESEKQWLETAILPAGPFSGSRPNAIAIQGDLAIIGDDHTNVGQRADAFQRLSDGTWVHRAVLEPEPNPWSTFYGRSVTIQGTRAIIGAHGEDQQSGAAYIYDLSPPTGDLTCDGVVTVPDLQALLDEWGPCPEPGETNENCRADLNSNGVVSVQDLLMLLGNWGS